MIRTEINPHWLEAEPYLALLNSGFQAQWNRRSFEWFHRRPFNGMRTDMAVRIEGERLLAGAFYCYRDIDDGSGRLLKVCVMGAGTTLASERGRGHYHALLQTGIDLCRARSAAALVGFVTAANPSGRGLFRLGAFSIASHYIVSTHRVARVRDLTRRTLRPRVPAPRPRHDIVSHRLPRRRGSMGSVPEVSFHYARPDDWKQQFLHRPNPVRCLSVFPNSVALVETVGATDRLQWLQCPDHLAAASIRRLASKSASAGRRFFMYTMDSLFASSAKRLGFGVRDGFVIVLPVTPADPRVQALAHARWRVQSGDRM